MRRPLGLGSAIAALVAFGAHMAAWLGFIPSGQVVAGVCFAGFALVMASAAASARALRPYYVVGKVMQLHKLRPFFNWPTYLSLCIVFALSLFGVVASISGTAEPSGEAVWKTFTASWSGFFYIDAMILLFAKAPNVSKSNATVA